MTSYTNTAALTAALSDVVNLRTVRPLCGSENPMAASIEAKRAGRLLIEWIEELAAEEARKARPAVVRRAEVPLYVAISDLGAIVTDRAEDFVQAREEIAYRRGTDGRVSRLGVLRFGELCG